MAEFKIALLILWSILWCQHVTTTSNFSCNPTCTENYICIISDKPTNKTECVDDPCITDRCKGHGTCIAIALDEGLTFQCQCKPGYTGKDCSIFSSENGCYDNPCQFSGECIPLNNIDYSCSCDGTGHFGRHCEIEDLCATKPCVNGVCELVGSTDSSAIDRRCRCRPGFTGVNCEVDINECDYQPCHNGMNCENLAGSYKCHCSPDFTGMNCSVPIRSMCTPQTCLNHGICKVGSYGPVCECYPGWRGDFCQFDVDECRTRSCQNGGTCLDQANATKCLCLPGWTGPNCEIDINECTSALSHGLCKNNGDCINVNGSYYCVCPIGYAGPDCSIIKNMCDERANLSCLNGGRCKSEIGYYRCECPHDWQGTYCELRNPCARNPCQNEGNCVQLFDHPEKYRCLCSAGFNGTNCEFDIDECKLNPCDTRATCENTIGSFKCHCPLGLSGQYCSQTSVFNCSAFQTCANGGTCISSIGGYSCNCPKGFGGLTCEMNIDDCIGNPCLNSGTCIDGIGTFKCLCASSFTGERCESVIDHCSTDKDYCYHGGSCVTFTDRFGKSASKCQCRPGFIGERCEADVNECASKPCDPTGTSSCANLPGDYLCMCYPGYTGRTCETIIGEHVEEKRPEECSKKCISLFGNGQCDVECNTMDCKFDGGDCAVDFQLTSCPIGCESVFANGQCDPTCNRKGCLWDGNDCLLDPFERSRYITGIKATYLMSCQAFHSGASSILLFNLSSLVGAATIEEPESMKQSDDPHSNECQVSLMFDKERCAKESCPETAESFVDFIKNNPREYTPQKLIDASRPNDSGLSRIEIVKVTMISAGALIVCVLVLACVLNRKRVRAKTWFPPGFFEVLRLSDQNTSQNPAKQRKMSASASTVASTSATMATPSHAAVLYPTGPQPGTTFYDPNLGMLQMTPPDRREQDLVDPPGPDGLTPLMLACTSAHLSNPPQRVAEIIVQLIQRGANPLARTVQREESSLHLAARYRNTVAVRMLMDYCTDINTRDAEGKTPLHSAVGADAQDCMRWLLRHQLIHVDARMNDGTTPLILATRLCLNSLATDLVRFNAKLDTQDGLGRTALHWAAAVDNVEAIHLLGRHGADKDAQDAREQTPLFLACREGNKNSVAALLELGAQRDLSDHADVSPRQVAMEAGYREVVRLLDEFMVDPSAPSTSGSLGASQLPTQQFNMPSSSQTASSSRPSSKVPSEKKQKQQLFVDLPPPYSEKPSVTAGADSSSQWATSSTWNPAQVSQMPSTISPHQNVQNRLTENFLTPSPDNHSSPASSSPNGTNPRPSSIMAQASAFNVGVSYATQPRQQRRQQTQPASFPPQFLYSVEQQTQIYQPQASVVDPSMTHYNSQQTVYYPAPTQQQQVAPPSTQAQQVVATSNADPVYF